MLLDTNALSAWAKDDPALFRVLRPDRPWFLSSITLGEYCYGLLKSVRRASLEQWLEVTESLCTVLSPDAQTARYYAALRAGIDRRGQMSPYHDLWIAALAQQHRLPIVSRDTDFDRMPNVQRVSW